MTPLCPCRTTDLGPRRKITGGAPRGVSTGLGWITLWRTDWYSARRQEGRFPLDAAWGLVESYSPGVARWMCRAGALAGSYQAASQDLLTQAGLEIDKVAALDPHRKPEKPDQRPEPDYGSTSYVAAIVTAQDFGISLRAEALRRGLAKAQEGVFLGDGAVGVWTLARLHFPGAVCILDYYHPCEHFPAPAHSWTPPTSDQFALHPTADRHPFGG